MTGSIPALIVGALSLASWHVAVDVRAQPGEPLAKSPDPAPGAPRERPAYEPGERIDTGVYVLDARQAKVPLRSLLASPVNYLLIFGGASGSSPASLWCDDSQADLTLHHAIRARFESRGVRFIAVAVPPVYSERRGGYPKGAFLALASQTAEYQDVAAAFVTRTEALRRGVIGFEALYFDPRYRLMDNPAMGPHTAEYGDVEPWQGRFKWKEDDQRHGTPTLWLLSEDGTVLREPFWGNVYNGEDRRIRYTEADVAGALERFLGRKKK